MTNRYNFRGIRQNSDRSIDLALSSISGFRVFRRRGAEERRPSMSGTWNALHTELATASEAWYESDLYATRRLGFGKAALCVDLHLLHEPGQTTSRTSRSSCLKLSVDDSGALGKGA